MLDTTDSRPDLRLVPMTAAHLPAIVPIHEIAFSGYMNVRLGRGYLRRFFGWFVDTPTAIACVALDGHQPIGYVVGAFVDDLPKMERELRSTVALCLLSRPWLFFDGRIRGAIWRRIAPHRQSSSAAAPEIGVPPVITLTGIGVAPTHRGLGVGRQLMREFESAAAQLAARSMLLFVYPTNQAAKHLYETAGWSCPDSTSATSNQSVRYWKQLDLQQAQQ